MQHAPLEIVLGKCKTEQSFNVIMSPCSLISWLQYSHISVNDKKGKVQRVPINFQLFIRFHLITPHKRKKRKKERGGVGGDGRYT